MEKGARYSMVMIEKKYNQEEEDIKQEKDPLFLPTPFTYGSVSVAQINSNQNRLDASAYNIIAMNALTTVRKNKYGWIYLWSDKGLIDKAYYPGRYKRIYCNQHNGIPFFLPSQLDEIYPKPTKYVSRKTADLLTNDYIKSNMLLISRSGTIGKCTISSKATVGKLFSDDVIRITFKDEYDLGYVYTFFNTQIGLSILQSNNYGAVIDHIEPEHLQNIPIPNAPKEIKKEIHKLIVESYDLRDQSNDLIDKAQQMLYKELELPEISAIKPKLYTDGAGFRNYTIKISQSDGRLDASYHLPEVNSVIDAISHNASEVTTLGDKRISKKIILAGIFKRVYVDSTNGVPFLGGRDIMQLSPKTEKYLSINAHKDRIEKELSVFENYILISDRGTIGKIQIVPKHWNGWAVSQNVIKLVPQSNLAGYIYTYLTTELAQILIKREIYGSVVDMIDDANVAHIPIPLLKNEEIQKQINDMVLYANDLRYQAYLKEQKALALMNDLLKEKKVKLYAQ